MDLINIFHKKNIKVYHDYHDWEKALHLSIQPLLEDGCVLPAYLNQILSETKAYGAYYILRPQVAVVHTRWQYGALADGISFSLFKETVDFSPYGDKVNLIIGFCAKDDFHHLEYLKEIAILLRNDNFVETLLASNTPEMLTELLYQSCPTMVSN